MHSVPSQAHVRLPFINLISASSYVWDCIKTSFAPFSSDRLGRWVISNKRVSRARIAPPRMPEIHQELFWILFCGQIMSFRIRYWPWVGDYRIYRIKFSFSYAVFRHGVYLPVTYLLLDTDKWTLPNNCMQADSWILPFSISLTIVTPCFENIFCNGFTFLLLFHSPSSSSTLLMGSSGFTAQIDCNTPPLSSACLNTLVRTLCFDTTLSNTCTPLLSRHFRTIRSSFILAA